MKGYPRGLEKNNLVPVHKKERKDLMKTCRPISFHPMFSKTLKGLH